jgi:type II secretory pathway component GspD/PulD (secretin)
LILRRGTEGSIITGEEVPIQTQTVTSGTVSTSTTFKSVGIKLRVTPVMVSGNKVRMKVAPEVSNVTRVDQSGAPIIAVRSANTELEMLDGQMVSIGGLLRTEEREVERRVPVLASIPLLGWFFRGKEKQSIQSQLVIFLSMRILSPEELETVDTVAKPPHKRVKDAMDRMEKSIKKPDAGFKNDLKLLKE